MATFEEQMREILENVGAYPSQLSAHAALERMRAALPPCSVDQLQRGPTYEERKGGGHPPLGGVWFEGVMAVSRLLTISNIQPLEPEEESTEYRLDFSAGDGLLVGFRGSIVDRDGTIWRSSMALQMYLNDGDYITTDGDQAEYVNFDDLFVPGQVYAPLLRPVFTTDKLAVKFANLSTTDTLQPTLTFWFLRKRDLDQSGFPSFYADFFKRGA